jgi:hypothetical protein
MGKLPNACIRVSVVCLCVGIIDEICNFSALAYFSLENEKAEPKLRTFFEIK